MPICVKEIQLKFMGFADFYCCFILGFSDIVRPMNDLTKKGVKWEWIDKCQNAFDTLKKRFTSAPVLVMPDVTKKMKIENNAYDYATGAVLSQFEEDGIWYPVTFYSKSMNNVKCN